MCQLNPGLTWTVKLWGIRGADRDAENTPQPQTIPVFRTHMRQTEINIHGLSQEGLSWSGESEHVCVCSQMIYGDLSRAQSRAGPFIYLAGGEVKREQSEMKLNM